MRTTIRNIIYSVAGNGLSLFVSVCMILIVPKILGLQDYGYWQLFLFYFSYVGFLHFGWEDGIYLRYSGLRYRDLDHSKILGQGIAIFGMQIFFSVLLLIFTVIKKNETDIGMVFYSLSIAIVLANSNNFFSLILQMTSRIREYAYLLVLEPIVFLLIVLIELLVGGLSYFDVIIAKICALLSVFLLGIILLNDLWQKKLPTLKRILIEAFDNLRVGSKLMLANIANMLIIGIVRWGISEGWDVVVFGKVSLILSISNFLLVFINAVSVVLLPALKRVPDARRKELYVAGRMLLSMLILSILLLYLPIREFLSIWLTKYVDSLKYLAVLFPVCLYEGKMSLLNNTFLKVIRCEKNIMYVNLFVLVISFFVTLITVMVIHSLTICVFSIVCIFAFRCYLTEVYIMFKIKHVNINYILGEIGMVLLFIFTSWHVEGILGMSVYFAGVLFYIMLNKNNIRNSWKIIR
ncbi:lipopolysaccharide biosynthesis protein [Selenomonas montiformis]|uniref:lipopolysaccharide biosynthesis protein n=1 Tax=Selenomonas montiformis TaxID=2652285 RepID=UPI0039F5C5C0